MKRFVRNCSAGEIVQVNYLGNFLKIESCSEGQPVTVQLLSTLDSFGAAQAQLAQGKHVKTETKFNVVEIVSPVDQVVEVYIATGEIGDNSVAGTVFVANQIGGQPLDVEVTNSTPIQVEVTNQPGSGGGANYLGRHTISRELSDGSAFGATGSFREIFFRLIMQNSLQVFYPDKVWIEAAFYDYNEVPPSITHRGDYVKPALGVLHDFAVFGGAHDMGGVGHYESGYTSQAIYANLNGYALSDGAFATSSPPDEIIIPEIAPELITSNVWAFSAQYDGRELMPVDNTRGLVFRFNRGMVSRLSAYTDRTSFRHAKLIVSGELYDDYK